MRDRRSGLVEVFARRALMPAQDLQRLKRLEQFLGVGRISLVHQLLGEAPHFGLGVVATLVQVQLRCAPGLRCIGHGHPLFTVRLNAQADVGRLEDRCHFRVPVGAA